MKVFFTASHRGKKYYQNVFDEIEKLGHKHLDDDLLKFSEIKFHSQKNLYQKKINSIQEAEVCVFETTISSSTIGYLIKKSLDIGKPTIVLYLKDNLPHFLLNVKEEKLIIRNYTNQNLKNIIKETLIQANRFRNKRFNFFITPDLLAYIEETSKKMNITKSTFIRNLINEHRKQKI
jgi:hypothetical protein